MSEKTEFSIIVRDGIKLIGFEWSVKNPKAAICMIHGLGEHSGRYEHVAQFFNENEFDFYAIDLRGHGLSEGKRGHTPTHERIVDDTEEFLMYVRAQHNELPMFLYGHSMGGNIVTNYVLSKNVNELQGAIISSPWLKTKFDAPKWQVALAKLVSKVFPSFTQPNGLQFHWLTNDDAVNKAYEKDPLVHDKVSVKLFIEFSESGIWALNHSDLLKIPVFIFHGADDQITSPEASQGFAEKCGDLAKYKLWTETQHEPHNDLRKLEVLDQVLKWVLGKI